MIGQMVSTVYTGDEDNQHHWEQSSQTYATAATLLHYVRKNWSVEPMVVVQSFDQRGGRYVNVYYFTLTRHAKRIEMPVLANPAVERLIINHSLKVERLNAAR